MAQALLNCVRLPSSEIPVKTLLWSTVVAATVCGFPGREAEAMAAAQTTFRAAGKNETRVEGAMVAVKGSCPLITFFVAGTMIWMDNATVLNGLSCAQLVNGTMVRVSGLRRQDGSILASAISAQGR